MKVHYFQHVPFEGLGHIEGWLHKKGHLVSATRFYGDTYRLPPLEDCDALVIMGGPMGVYDDLKYPWLKEEKAFIREAIRDGKKVLGICLGAQLIAAVCGAPVNAAPRKEIGWYPVYPTRETGYAAWLRELLQEEPVVFHWHGDQFGIPSGACNLAYSKANENQAFLLNDNVLGLQFHLEMTPGSLAALTAQCAEELVTAPFIQTREELLAAEDKITISNKYMESILDNFLKDDQSSQMPDFSKKFA